MVSIHGITYTVRADIRRIDSYSGHGDYHEMGEFLLCQDPEKVKKFFIVHGEYEVQEKYT